ncbi:MAG: hypothetical protein KDA37_08775 [Planctomycetales bacterium]|nr:hypothetical protein [Planctomycetales bacterium]
MSDSYSIPLVLADWGQIIGLLLLVVFWVLRYLFSDEQPQKKKPPERLPPRPEEPRPEQQGAQQVRPAEQGQRDLRAEVDEFLRKSKQQPVVQQQAPREQRPAKLVVELEPEAPAGESLSDHVQRHITHLQESQLAEQAAHLGEQVALADDKVQARLDAKFKHRLGSIKSREEEPTLAVVVEPGVGPDQIAAMLASPESIKTAIILNEILQRPTDRW